MRIEVTLDPLSMLMVKSTPAGAKVSVDGAPPVLAPAEIEITSGLSHRVDAWVPGLPPESTVAEGRGRQDPASFDLCSFEDPRDRRARGELARLHTRAASDRRKLSRTEARGGNEYIWHRPQAQSMENAPQRPTSTASRHREQELDNT